MNSLFSLSLLWTLRFHFKFLFLLIGYRGLVKANVWEGIKILDWELYIHI